MADCAQELCPNWSGDGRVCPCAVLDLPDWDDPESDVSIAEQMLPAGYRVLMRDVPDDEPAAVGTAGGGQTNASDLGSVETQKGNTE